MAREYTFHAGAFPGAMVAAGYFEMMCVSARVDKVPSIFEMIMTEYPHVDPPRTVELLKKSVDEEIVLNEFGDLPRLKIVRAQMDHPDFLKYVGGKMGAV